MVTAIPRLVIAAPSSGSGKTTVATGLMAALRVRGLKVSPHKVGPDFIDPSYHALATGRPGRNLDSFLCGVELIEPLFLHGARGADIAIVEGVMGLYDGATGHGELASTAHIAKLLDAPVVLVVDARAVGRSVAALVSGFAAYDAGVRIAGLILNKVGSPTHEAILREALRPLGIPVVGALARDDRVAMPSRHLGLVPAAERAVTAPASIAAMSAAVAAGCDLEALIALAHSAPPLAGTPWSPGDASTTRMPVAVAGGPAFSFTYTEHLEMLAALGAEIRPLDPLTNESLGDAAALYLPGGFPELHASSLSENELLRKEIGAFDGPIIAECGGLLYLARSLDGQPMCDVIDADGVLGGRLSLGYRTAEAASDSPLAAKGTPVRAHEFHYSTLSPAAGSRAAWRIGERREGFASPRLHASYLHTHWAGTPGAPRRLMASVSR
ncbi:MAG: cobyrinate a,c-diamide synthase [Actinomycetota bacterium]